MKLCVDEPPKFYKTSNNLIVLAWYCFPLPFPSCLWINQTLKTTLKRKFNKTKCSSTTFTFEAFLNNSIFFGSDPSTKENWSFTIKINLK
jgi:hypothetical protein